MPESRTFATRLLGSRFQHLTQLKKQKEFANSATGSSLPYVD
jgi:hypothetical protein